MVDGADFVGATFLVDRAEVGRDGAWTDLIVDFENVEGAEGRALFDATGTGRTAAGGAWPYLLGLRLTMIFWGALIFGSVSLLLGLTSFLGPRIVVGLATGLVVGSKLFGGGGGGISSAESPSSRLGAASCRKVPGLEMVC